MQKEIKIVLFQPTTNPNNYAADVYVDGERKHCGKGGQTANQAVREAIEFAEPLALECYIGEYARSVESGWLGKVVGVNGDMLTMQGVYELAWSMKGGHISDHLCQDDTQWFTPEDLKFVRLVE